MIIESFSQPQLNATNANFAQMPWYGGFGYATCGELIQGSINRNYFLVNFPLNYYSHVQVKYNSVPGIHVNSTGDYRRLIAALKHFLQYLGKKNVGLDVRINTAVPRSKGLASSTSELCAALCAAAKTLNVSISADLISKIITSVEPSDGTYYSGIIRYNPLTGEVYERFGNPPSLSCILIDTGGTLDTDTYDRDRALEICFSFESKIRYALSLIRCGFEQQSSSLIAKAATISAQCNQKIRFNSAFDYLLKESLSHGALGVNCAHTGTICGVLFDPQNIEQEQLQHNMELSMGSESILGCYSLISGGI